MSDAKRYTNLREFAAVLRYEWRTRRSWRSWRAALCGAWWWLIRRYPSEICNCGHPVGRWIGNTYWIAENALWADVAGWDGWREELGEMAYLGPPGTLCPRCFTERARAKGIRLYWEPRVDER